jgi:Flp pilus assembly protein TadB
VNPFTGFWAEAAGGKADQLRTPKSRAADVLDWCGGLAAGLLAGRLYFHETSWILAAAAVISAVIHGMLGRIRTEKHQQHKSLMLKDSLGMLALYLRAGYSLAEATRAVGLELQYRKNEKDEVADAWRQTARKLDLNRPIGLVYEEWAKKIEAEPAVWLSGMLNAGIKSGANLVAIVLETEEQLQAQIDFEAQRSALLAARQLEALIMAAAPLVLTFLLSLAMEDYVKPLYQGKGPWVMLAVLLMQLGGGYGSYQLISGERFSDSESALAIFMDCMAQLIQAGLTLPAAWRQAAAFWQRTRAGQRQGKRRSVKETEADRMVAKVAGALALKGSLSEALSAYAQHCPEGPTARIAMMILQNLRRGGPTLGSLLMQEAAGLRRQELLSLQRRSSRTEQWLLFPLALMLISSLILAASPAILSL